MSENNTVFRVRLNGARVKVIFHRGLTIEEACRLQALVYAVNTFQDLCGLFRESAKRTGQTMSLIVESQRTIPDVYSSAAG
jgi:hypothetical protein